MNKMKISISIVFVILFTGNLIAQQDSSVFVVPEMKIYQKEKSGDVVYTFGKENNLIYLFKDSLFVSPQYYKYSVNLNSVDKLALRNGTFFWGAAKVGAITGGILGFLAGGFLQPVGNPGGGSASDKNSSVVFNPLGAIVVGVALGTVLGGVFGLVGLLTPYYDIYELNKVVPNQKQIYLSKVLKKIQSEKKRK